MQPPKAGPVRTSSDPPDCLPTLQSHTASQSLTTTPTAAPPGVRNTAVSLIQSVPMAHMGERFIL